MWRGQREGEAHTQSQNDEAETPHGGEAAAADDDVTCESEIDVTPLLGPK